MKKHLIVALFLSFSAITKTEDPIRVPNASLAHLYYAKKKWEVEKEGQRYEIARCFVDQIARDIPEDKLEEFLQYIALRVSEFDNGEFALKAHARGLGGGPVAGFVAYWTVRVAGYTAVALGITAAGTAAVAVAGTVAPAVAPVVAGATTLIGVGTGPAAVAGGAVAGTIVATKAGAAAMAAVAGAAAADATVIAATATQTLIAAQAAGASVAATAGAVVATIEGAATTAGAALLACPFLP